MKRGLSASIILRTGSFLQDILEVVEASDYGMIVMGSHGTSGKQEWFIGSNTQKVVRKVSCNTLVVKYPLEEINFKRVMFASNLFVEEQEALREFLKFLSFFEVEELHVLTVDTLGFLHQPKIVIMEALAEFKEIAKEHDVKTHFYNDYSVEAGIRHFADELSIDLVGISNRKKHPLKRLFQGSNVEMLVNHMKHPVFCIDY